MQYPKAKHKITPGWGAKQAIKPKPKPKPAVGGYPPAPAQPPVSTLGDSRYLAETNAANREYGDTIAGLGNREFGIKEQFGYDPQFAQNPYTRANMMARAYQQKFAGTGNAAASRGQLYSGSLDRARASDAFSYGAEQDTARREYTSQLAEIEAARLAAERGKAGAYDTAFAGQVERAQDAAPDPSLFVAPARVVKKKKKKKGKK